MRLNGKAGFASLSAICWLAFLGVATAQVPSEGLSVSSTPSSLLVVASEPSEARGPGIEVFDARTQERLHTLLPRTEQAIGATTRQLWPLFSDDGLRCCVVANPSEGILRGFAWNGSGYSHVRDVNVGFGVVDLQLTQGGSKIVVLSRETIDPWDTATAFLRVVDFQSFQVTSTIPLGAPVELRDDSGSQATHQLAVDDQGFAYVAVERSQIRPVNLRSQKLWDLYSPGRNFDAAVIDLKVVDGTLYTLCRGLKNGVASSCLDWVDPISGSNGRLELEFAGSPDVGLSIAFSGFENDRPRVFVHGERAIYVLDQKSHQFVDAIEIPEGSSEIAVSETLPGIVILVPGQANVDGTGRNRLGRLHFIRMGQQPWRVSQEFVALESGSRLNYVSQSALLVLPSRLGEIIATMVPENRSCLLVELDRYGRPSSALPQYKILELENRPTFIRQER